MNKCQRRILDLQSSVLPLPFFSKALRRDLSLPKQILPDIRRWPRDGSETSGGESERLGDNSWDVGVSCYFHSHSLFIPSVLNLLPVSRSYPIRFCFLRALCSSLGVFCVYLKSASLQMQKYPRIYHPLKNYLPP